MHVIMTASTVHKLIISGTGRAGTTFLVRLLTELGFDTGFSAQTWHNSYDEHCHAGLEHSLDDPKGPYIIKNPALSAELPTLLQRNRQLAIDHAIIPIRDLDSASRSRVRNGRDVPGGLWLTDDPTHQKTLLAEHFHGLIHCLVHNEIPFTFLDFPRFAIDADYTYRKLEFLFGSISREQFQRVFNQVSNPGVIHDYARESGPGVTDASIKARYQEEQQQRESKRRRAQRKRQLRRAASALVILASLALAILTLNRRLP